MTDQTSDPDLVVDRGSCTETGRHQHRWKKIIDGKKWGTVIEVGPSGVVILSEGVVEQLLAQAGWEQVPA